MTEPRVGPIRAASLLTAWSSRGRLRSEADLARLAGAAPLPVSSGNTTRHRHDLDRGGDRRLNPRRTRTFTNSRDPQLVGKVVDIVEH